MAAEKSTQAFPYVRLYTDERGETHFSNETLMLTGERFMSGPPVTTASFPIVTNQNPHLAHVPHPSAYEWHASFRKQWLLVVQGAVEFTASDGEARRFPAGSLVLFEDISGKGHKTQTLGPEDHVALAIPLSE